eukprot:1802096-Amphidinium_carterae.1
MGKHLQGGVQCPVASLSGSTCPLQGHKRLLRQVETTSAQADMIWKIHNQHGRKESSVFDMAGEQLTNLRQQVLLLAQHLTSRSRSPACMLLKRT